MTGEEQGVWSLGLILLSAGVTVACIVLGRRRLTLSATLLILMFVWATVWAIGQGLHDSDWHNVTGWVDCRTSCTTWHVVGGWLFFGPLIMVVWSSSLEPSSQRSIASHPTAAAEG